MMMRSNPRNVAFPRAFNAFPVIAPGPGTVLEDEPEVVHSVEGGEGESGEALEGYDSAQVNVGGAIGWTGLSLRVQFIDGSTVDSHRSLG
jgi:hypothetical protein